MEDTIGKLKHIKAFVVTF